MDDDELNEELDDEISHEIDSNHEDAVLKTPPDSIKSKSPEPTAPSTDVNIKKVILKRKLIVAVSDNASTNEVSSTTPLEKTRKFTITSSTATTDRTIGAPDTDKSSDDATDKKVVKISQLTAKERLELRAKKFGAPIATESLKAARSERFGLTPVTTSSDAKTEASASSSVKNGSSSTVNVDILKKRAERFGGSVSKEMNTIENQEKLQKRSERFGKSDENKVTVSAVSVSSDEMAEKARLRLERFKTTA